MVRPWLTRTHPNFALIFIATAVFHLWFGAAGVFGPDRRFASPSLVRVNALASHEVWGWVSLLIGATMILGLFQPSFTLARVAVAVGMAVCCARWGLLLEALTIDPSASINGGPVWMLIAALHLSQTLEPPSNPAAGR
jgi:hypothetical protein